MFRNTFQSGFLSILYSIGSKPLQIWDKKVRNGHIKRITDQDIQSSVLEIMGTNVSTNFITCPADPKKTLGIKLPFPRYDHMSLFGADGRHLKHCAVEVFASAVVLVVLHLSLHLVLVLALVLACSPALARISAAHLCSTCPTCHCLSPPTFARSSGRCPRARSFTLASTTQATLSVAFERLNHNPM